MSSGGKGGKSKAKAEIPKWASDFYKDVIDRAGQVSSMDYAPYMGPTVAAVNDFERAAADSVNAASSAYGLGTATPFAGLPEAQDFGGVQGYSSYPVFQQAVSELMRNPVYAEQHSAPFLNQPAVEAPPAMNLPAVPQLGQGPGFELQGSGNPEGQNFFQQLARLQDKMATGGPGGERQSLYRALGGQGIFDILGGM